MSKFEIRSLKTFRGVEGPAFDCILYVDGVKAADVLNDGWGGCYRWTWLNKEAKVKWDAYVAAQPEEPYGFGMDGTFKPDGDFVVEGLVMALQDRKKMLRQMKTLTLFRLKGDKEKGLAYHSVKMPFDHKAIEWLHKKFGDELVEIINETLLAEVGFDKKALGRTAR